MYLFTIINFLSNNSIIFEKQIIGTFILLSSSMNKRKVYLLIKRICFTFRQNWVWCYLFFSVMNSIVSQLMFSINLKYWERTNCPKYIEIFNLSVFNFDERYRVTLSHKFWKFPTKEPHQYQFPSQLHMKERENTVFRKSFHRNFGRRYNIYNYNSNKRISLELKLNNI